MLPTIAVIAKSPERGRVKTRLAAAVGDDAALSVYRALLAHTAQVLTAWEGSVEVFWAGDDRLMATSPIGRFPRSPQVEGGLGARLAGMCTAVLTRRADSGVIVIASDCAELQLAHLLELAAIMRDDRLAIGPALDGGYYLVAVRAAQPALFQDIPWSADDTLARTLEAARAAGLRVRLLAPRADVDSGADWKRWQNEPTRNRSLVSELPTS